MFHPSCSIFNLTWHIDDWLVVLSGLFSFDVLVGYKRSVFFCISKVGTINYNVYPSVCSVFGIVCFSAANFK